MQWEDLNTLTEVHRGLTAWGAGAWNERKWKLDEINCLSFFFFYLSKHTLSKMTSEIVVFRRSSCYFRGYFQIGQKTFLHHEFNAFPWLEILSQKINLQMTRKTMKTIGKITFLSAWLFWKYCHSDLCNEKREPSRFLKSPCTQTKRQFSHELCKSIRNSIRGQLHEPGWPC